MGTTNQGHGGVYQILHAASGKVYVGSAVHLEKRHAQHQRMLRAGKHHNVKLQRAWDKYGEGAFVFKVLEHVPEPATLLQREQAWIDALDAVAKGFNLTPTAGSILGMKFTNESKRRMSSAATGKTKSPEHVANVAAALRGRKMTDEQRQKMRDAKLGKKRGPHSAETKARMSAAAAGKKKSPEHVAALKAAAIGRKQSPETRAKRGAAISAAYWAKHPKPTINLKESSS